MRNVRICYTNHRGERRERVILPTRIYFGSNEWHKEPQWLMLVHDFEKGESRHIAVKDISSWTAEETAPQKEK